MEDEDQIQKLVGKINRIPAKKKTRCKSKYSIIQIVSAEEFYFLHFIFLSLDC